MKRDKLIEELEEFAAEYPSDCGVYKTLKQAAQMLREDGEEIKKLKGELEEARDIECEFCDGDIGKDPICMACCKEIQSQRDTLKAALEKARVGFMKITNLTGNRLGDFYAIANGHFDAITKVLAQSLNPTLAKEPKEGGECEECGGSRYLEREYPVSTAIDPSGKRTYKRTCDYCKPEGHDPTGQEEKCVHDFDEISGECRECGLPTKPEVEDE